MHGGVDHFEFADTDLRVNLRVCLPDDIVIKDSYWISKSRNLSGNTIDFFVLLEGLPFHKAVEIILVAPYAGTNAAATTPAATITQSQLGNTPKSLR